MEKRLRKPVAATLNCPGLSLLACIKSLIIGEYTNQIISTPVLKKFHKKVPIDIGTFASILFSTFIL